MIALFDKVDSSFSREQMKTWLPRLLVLLLLFVTIVYPLWHLFLASLQDQETWSLKHYFEFFNARSSHSLEALGGSLFVSLATVLLAALIGIPLAFLFERFELPGKRLLSVLATLPIVLPPLVGVVAFMVLLGDTGILPRLLQVAFGLEQQPFRLQGVSGILIVHAYSFYVYFFLFVRAALKRLDGATIEAAQSLGASRLAVLFRVVLPQLRPALIASGILVFMISMASFSAPLLFAGNFRILTVEIFKNKMQGNMPMAIAQSVMLAVISIVFLILSIRRQQGGGVAGQKGVPLPPRPIRSAGARFAAVVLAALASFVLALPHLTLLLISFVEKGTWTSQILPDTFTLEYYRAVFADPRVSEPILNSLKMATLATLANLLIATLVAYWNTQKNWRFGRMGEMMIMLPWAVPGTVIAIALIVAFNQPHWFTGGAVLVGSFWILPLAYFIRHLPVVYRAGHAAFQRFDPAQEEAARSLGAGSVMTFRRVLLPAIRPALLSGALLAAVMSLGEFVSSILLYTYENKPISMAIYNEFRDNLGGAATYGVLLTILIFAISWLSEKWGEI